MKHRDNIKREEEKHVKVAFRSDVCGDAFYGSAVIVDGELTKLQLKPSDYRFSDWFKTKAHLGLLRRFLKAVEKEILYGKEE